MSLLCHEFGFSFVCDDSSVHFSLVRLIKEIRDKFISVPGFDRFTIEWPHVTRLLLLCSKIHQFVVWTT